MLGFPDKALDKVINKLESNRVSYIVLGEDISKEYDNDNYNKYIELCMDKYKISNLIENNIKKISLDKLEDINNIIINSID